MDTPDSSNRTSKAVPRERAHMRRRGRDMPARLEPPAPPAAARQRMGIGIGIGDRGHVCGRPRARSVSSGRSHAMSHAALGAPVPSTRRGLGAGPSRAVRRRLTCLTRHLFVPESGGPDVDAAACPASTALNILSLFFFSSILLRTRSRPSRSSRARDRRRAFIGAAANRVPTALLSHQRLRRKPYFCCCERVGQSATSFAAGCFFDSALPPPPGLEDAPSRPASSPPPLVRPCYCCSGTARCGSSRLQSSMPVCQRAGAVPAPLFRAGTRDQLIS